MRPAFLFLTPGNHNQGALWEAFFDGHHPARYDVYCHPKHPEAVTQDFLKPNIIRERVETEHAGLSLVRATRLLLYYGLQEPENGFFILLSDSCIPLYGLPDIATAVSSVAKSWIAYSPNAPETHKRWAQVRNKEAWPRQRFYKQHQWMILTREAAEMALASDYTADFEDVFAPDEVYFVNHLAREGLPLDQKVLNHPCTFVNWNEPEIQREPVQDPATGEAQTFVRIRPKTYHTIQPQDVEMARQMGCLFFRKVGADCDCRPLFAG